MSALFFQSCLDDGAIKLVNPDVLVGQPTTESTHCALGKPDPTVYSGGPFGQTNDFTLKQTNDHTG